MLITLSLGLKGLTKSYPNLDPVDQSHEKKVMILKVTLILAARDKKSSFLLMLAQFTFLRLF